MNWSQMTFCLLNGTASARSSSSRVAIVHIFSIVKHQRSSNELTPSGPSSRAEESRRVGERKLRLTKS